MSDLAEREASPITRWSKVRGICCWAAATLGCLTGLSLLVLPDSWPNDRVKGAVLLVGNLALFPPILRVIRRRVRVAASAAAPVIYAILLIPLAALIGSPLTPSVAEQGRLQQLAMHQATALLSEGHPDAARRALRKFVVRRSEDNQLAALLEQIEAEKQPMANRPAAAFAPATAVTSERQQEPASAYVERVTTYWLPELRAMPDTAPPEEEAIGKLLSQLDGLVVDVEDGDDLPLTVAQKAVRGKLEQAIGLKQANLLPSLRRRYAEALDAKLFRRDIRVLAQGATLQLTGAVFARNANVEDVQTELQPVVGRLRFHRVEYRWSPYVNDSLRYDLHPPSDPVLARWDGTAFAIIPR